MFILGWFIIVAVLWKLYLKLRTREHGSYSCLVGKTAIVTGANTGIGYITALDFAKRGARVILACRDRDRAEDAKRKIIKATQNSNVVYKLVDLTSLESVRALAKEINGTEERIDILVNNAGIGGVDGYFTKDGLEITLQVNHISGFLLTHLLIDKIKMSVPSRIVNVSSMAAKRTKLNIEEINKFPSNERLASWKTYSNSKLCNILFTVMLADKLRDAGVTVNALHPGTVKTEIFRNVPRIIRAIVNTLADLYFKTPEEGARTTIYVATSPKLNGVTGKLFDNCREIDLYDTAQDPVLVKKVWEKSEEFAKLNPKEKIN